MSAMSPQTSSAARAVERPRRPAPELTSVPASGPALPARVAERSFRCSCGQPVFFPDLQCLACDTPLGYDPERAQLLPLSAGEVEGTWRAIDTDAPASTHQADRPFYRRCGNFGTAAQCNWLITADASGAADAELCRCCRLNRFIPNLEQAPNPLW